MELIDRKSAINAVLGLKNCYNGFSDTYDKSCIVGLLEELPKVDAEPVIRCKDCKYKVVTDNGEWYELDVVCSYWETDGLTADDYCSYGERGIYKPDEA